MRTSALRRSGPAGAEAVDRHCSEAVHFENGRITNAALATYRVPRFRDTPLIEVGTGDLVRLDLATGAVDWSVKLDTMPFGAATISNDLVFTTLYDGRVVAYSTADGSQVWSAQLPAGTNSPLVIAGDRLVTAAGVPQGPDQKAALVVFQLNGTPRLRHRRLAAPARARARTRSRAPPRRASSPRDPRRPGRQLKRETPGTEVPGVSLCDERGCRSSLTLLYIGSMLGLGRRGARTDREGRCSGV